MMLLTAPFDPGATRRGDGLWAPSLLAVALALALLSVGLAMEMLDAGLLRGVGLAVASTAVHGGFLAVGWIVVVSGRPTWRGPVLRLALILLLASVASRVTAWGGLLYLLLPILLFREERRYAALRGIGIGLTAGLKPTAIGLAAGAVLGVHFLISSSLTFGYGIRVAPPSQYLSAAAYDIGANGLTAEWLFRGALFSRWWQRWEFWPAAALSTALLVGRYVLDPSLPPALEVRAGAVFYMSLLGFSSCALRAWSGSLLPGYLATVAFFTAYRMLAQ
jgi:hypothetical protein